MTTATPIPTTPTERRTRNVILFKKDREIQYVGDRLRNLRTARGLTQRQVAEGQYTAAYISALERGLAAPSLASMLFLGRKLDVEPSWFLRGIDKMAKASLPKPKPTMRLHGRVHWHTGEGIQPCCLEQLIEVDEELSLRTTLGAAWEAEAQHGEVTLAGLLRRLNLDE